MASSCGSFRDLGTASEASLSDCGGEMTPDSGGKSPRPLFAGLPEDLVRAVPPEDAASLATEESQWLLVGEDGANESEGELLNMSEPEGMEQQLCILDQDGEELKRVAATANVWVVESASEPEAEAEVEADKKENQTQPWNVDLPHKAGPSAELLAAAPPELRAGDRGRGSLWECPGSRRSMPEWGSALQDFPGVTGAYCLGRLSVPEAHHQCPNGHNLLCSRSPNENFVCDKCDKPLAKGSVMASCRQCDYDLCDLCFSEAPGREALLGIIRVVVRNDGDMTWPKETTLRLVAGCGFGFDSLGLGPLAPGHMAELVVDVMVPAVASSHAGERSAWVLEDGLGRPFGPLLVLEVLWPAAL